MMHDVVLATHLVGLVACFYAVYIISKQKNKEKSNYMIATIICNIITLTGYILELTSSELSAMMVAVKIEYLGKTFVGTFLLFTFIRYYDWKFPKSLLKVFWFVDIIMFFIVFTSDRHKLYYSSIGIKEVKGHMFISLGKTPLYAVFMAYMLIELLMFSMLCYRSYKTAYGREKKIQGSLALASSVTDIVIILSITGLCKPYDMVPMIVTTLTVLIAVLIKKYGLFATLDIAKEDLITNLDTGVIVRNTDGSFQYANPMAYEILPELHTRSNAEIRCLIDGILVNADGDVYLKDNRYYQIQTRMLYEDKEAVGQIITLFDATTLHEYSRKMEQLKIEADKANHAKSSFLANMSHEIRTPINAVLGMDEMILREEEDDNIKEYAESIKRAGETLLSLVSDILDFSKIESGKMNLINVEYNIRELLKDIVSTFSIRMSEKGLSFLIEADSSIPSVLQGDEVRIKQILMNLLSNACKYTNEGYVKLKVTGERRQGKFILRVAVEDSGIGIKEENIGRLFESFERLDEKKNRNIEGTGLGLNITRNLLNLMDSDINVKSRYGEGSIFSFEIVQDIVSDEPMGDINDSVGKYADKILASEEFTAPDGRILVVDDNAVNLVVMKGLLKKMKVNVETATSGVECLEMVKRTRYHIIFMDHLMPEMDGIETLHKMSELEDNLNKLTPVIALTANAVSGAKEQYIKEGFDDYMTKPVDMKVIEKIMRKFLPEDIIQ